MKVVLRCCPGTAAVKAAPGGPLWLAVLVAGHSAWPGALWSQAGADSATADTLPRAVLPPVTVSIARAEAALSSLPYAVSAVAADAWRPGRPTAGLDEALLTVPGVFVANRYNYALDQRVAIRGFGARSAFGVRGVKVLLDGIPQTLPDGQGQLTNVDLAAVERAEVWRGAASVLYGNAAGGVISLRTSLEEPGLLRPELRLVVGGYGFLKGAVRADAPVGAGSLHAAGSRMTTDGFRVHSAAEQRRLSIRAAYPVGPGTRVTLLSSFADDPLAQSPGTLTRAEMDSLPRLADPRYVATEAGKVVTQGQVGASVHRRLSSGASVELVAFGQGREVENPLPFAVIALDRWAYGARSTATLPWGDGGQLATVGADLQWQRDDRRNLSPDRRRVVLDQLDRVVELGSFAQVRVPVGAGVSVTAGARYDRVGFRVDDRLPGDGDQSGERTLAALSAMGGVTVERYRGVVPYVSVGTSFETPTTTELLNRPDGRPGLNPELEPQRAVHYELGARGRGGTWFSYELAAFHADVRDELIPFESPVEPGRRVFRNAGASRHRGLEAGLTVRPLPGVAATAAYTYADYRFETFRVDGDTLDGNRIPGVPVHRLHWTVRYEAPAGGWVAVDNTYTSAVPADDTNAAEAAAWWVAAVRGGWRTVVSGWRVELFAGAENLLDRRYAGSVVINARGGRYFEPAPGRTLLVGAELGRW